MPLLNVRLGPEDARAASALREAGANLSSIVRRALRAEYEQRVARSKRTKRPSQIVAEILHAVADPAGLPGRTFDSRNRRAVQRRIARKLGKRR